MEELYKQRLLKLADFLEKVPNKHFDLDEIVKDKDRCSIAELSKKMKQIGKGEEIKCGAVGCACGFLPVVFPKDFEYIDENLIEYSTDGKLYWNGYAVRKFFNIGNASCGYLFLSNNYKVSSKKNVISRIRKFVKNDGKLPNICITSWC